jgi:hypothetical protein
MPRQRQRLARCIGISAVALAVLLAGLTPVIGGAATNQEDHPHAGDGINEGQMNVTLSDYRPGAEEVDIEFSMVGGDGFRDNIHSWGFEYLDTFAWEAPHGPSLKNCAVSDVSAAGIDRDNDNEGTNTDVSIMPYLKGAYLRADAFGATFYKGDEFASPGEEYKGGPGPGAGAGRTDGDSNVEYYPDDRIYAQLSSCVTNPEQEGWYQYTVKVNGSNWDGYQEGAKLNDQESHQGEFTAVTLNSNWIPICEGCETYSDGRKELGPPPGEDTTESPTPTATSTPNSGSATPTATANPATPSPTATPIPRTATPTADSGTPSPTPTPVRRTSTETPTSISTDTRTSTATPKSKAADRTSTANSGDQSQSGQQSTRAQSESDPLTPTAGDGPGFGVLSLIVSMIVVIGYRLKK